MEENKVMFAELLKVAEEQLPKATSDLLRKRLDKLDQLEIDYETLKKNSDFMLKENQRLLKEVSAFEAIENKEHQLKVKEADLKAREDELWKKGMEKDLECLKTINANIVDFTKGLIRNTEFRKEVFGNQNYYDQHGNYRSNNDSKTETTKSE